jgi:hypothetical protein
MSPEFRDIEFPREAKLTLRTCRPVATDIWTDNDPEVLAQVQPIIDATPAAVRVGEVSDIVPIVV